MNSREVADTGLSGPVGSVELGPLLTGSEVEDVRGVTETGVTGAVGIAVLGVMLGVGSARTVTMFDEANEVVAPIGDSMVEMLEFVKFWLV